MFPNILVTDARTQTELFDRVASHLTKIGYVTADYYQALVEREASFPTGLKIDLKDGSDILYAAIPHTETKHCLVNQVIYVKNSHPLAFQHMINPEETCFVTDFFFIINSQNEGQTTILSNLITFFITKGNLSHLASLKDDKKAISNYLIEKGVFQHD
ncbi:PTS sugar transporter subunit IIA [Streptococcus dysgalactiae]|uniref:PTS system galactitol-specific IIA component n=1 Tax=Streptococcus dysgalactiae TaxID=1334 RepID=A0ABU0A516_STRDY|nr:PTS sugar transporter subunit IIA [Streptococcus dysgalactiae]ADX25197.1 PTS system, galactose-specific IIA component [Streptococcus dysgalactiae subsp. equisimilis ATCC 12394]EGL48486.1 phosphoenolpyruvate-dependent sugar phosphotransferase system, EIIA 2 [Streptococcus dysgalactiae subsp. equisimilis SK1249]MCB2832527.1 PTS sugar transporter subunit IIA [Streptococcus dysgalactiae subsp. dysgalactiae]MCB2840301.1 PTS sugar transporter subunit IIA [Streptococcus dysgalactiae subsp. dysgalac